ncbi:MAG: ElyC/SanA/YdcF family protein [Caldilineaceae bacterium]
MGHGSIAAGGCRPCWRDRVDTAIALYQAGKVDKLLMSGDNSTPEYDEPGAMMAYAIAQGVPAADIQPDYAGRRTYDTCYRAQAIFHVEDAVLVTQAFHLPRALFTCHNLGLDAQGVIADRRIYDPRSVAWSESRGAGHAAGAPRRDPQGAAADFGGSDTVALTTSPPNLHSTSPPSPSPAAKMGTINHHTAGEHNEAPATQTGDP